MQRLKKAAANRIVVFKPSTATHMLLHFVSNETDGEAFCVVARSGSNPVIVNFTETASPVALSGQVSLSPLGEWDYFLYDQNSSTNLDPDDAELLDSGQVYVVGDAASQGSYTPAHCDPATARNSDSTYSLSIPSGTTSVLPDVTHTDSDGSPAVRPAMTPFVATVCGAPVEQDFYYAIAIGHP